MIHWTWPGIYAALVLVTGHDDQKEPPRDGLESLSARQIAELRADEREFEAMPKEKRAAIIALQNALQAAPDREDLEATVNRYALWLDTLTPSQRSLLDSATTTDGRLALVKKLLDEQKRQLDKDLQRLHEHEAIGDPMPGRGNPFFSPVLPQDIQKRIKQLNERASQQERRLLNSLRFRTPRDAAVYSMLLGIRYGMVSFPPNAGDWLSRFVPQAFRETEFYRQSFGDVPIAQLSPPDRARLREFLEFSFALPEVTTAKVFAAYPTTNDPRRRLYQTMCEDFAVRPFSLVYYFDHLAELPSDKRTRFERLLRQGSAVATELDRTPTSPKLDAREKAKRFLKKAAKDGRDG